MELPEDRVSSILGEKPVFVVGCVIAGFATLFFLLWVSVGLDGVRATLWVDDVGQGVAAWCATGVCCVAALRASAARRTWALFAASSFAWGSGEVVWCYYALIKSVPVPFPGPADVGFLTAVPLAFAGLLLYPIGPRRPIARLQEALDGCIIATSLLFASWATVLGPLYRSHEGGVLKQIVSLAYPTSDVVMVSLVIILIARVGQAGRTRLSLVMAGVVAFAVADSAFAYLTEVNSYNGGSYLDTGWVAGYLLIALGALWATTSRTTVTTETYEFQDSTVSIVAPYAPVLVVLAVTGFELMLGHHLETVSWLMVCALAVLVLGREALHYLEGIHPTDGDFHDIDLNDPVGHLDPHLESELLKS